LWNPRALARTMQAVCLAGARARSVQLKVLDDEHVEWQKCKYRLYMQCSASSLHRLSVFMRVKYFQPLQCSEADLHPVAFPPPLSRGVFYGPLLVLGGTSTWTPFSLVQWEAAWSGMQDNRWSMSQDMTTSDSEDEGEDVSSESESSESESSESSESESESEDGEDSENAEEPPPELVAAPPSKRQCRYDARLAVRSV
jgi:hypothetical protein